MQEPKANWVELQKQVEAKCAQLQKDGMVEVYLRVPGLSEDSCGFPFVRRDEDDSYSVLYVGIPEEPHRLGMQGQSVKLKTFGIVTLKEFVDLVFKLCDDIVALGVRTSNQSALHLN